MPQPKNKASAVLAAAQIVDQATREHPLTDATVDEIIKQLKKCEIRVSISNMVKLRLYARFLPEERGLMETRGHDPEFYESLLALPEEFRPTLAKKLLDSRLTAQNAKIMLTLLHRLWNSDSNSARGIIDSISVPINPKKISAQITHELERFA